MLLALTGVVIMCSCATKSGFKAGAPEGAIDIIAHRGASAYAPENTLSAFNLAADLKADWFELDCTLTKDGEVLVIHDDTTERTTGHEARVEHMTLAELKQLDAGTWKDAKFAGERLPTLGESLELARDRGIGVYIEVKNSDDDTALMDRILEMAEGHATMPNSQRAELIPTIRRNGSRNFALAERVIAEVRRRNMQDQVVIQSFSPIVCAVTLQEAPDIRTELLGCTDDKKPERWPWFQRWAALLRPAGFNVSNGTLDQELVKQWHRDGMTTAIWTVDEESDVRRLAEWGVDAIITNKPDVCLKALAEAGKR
jgi:glycerophosphoryl diester phosphodiesterase